jgi:peptidyl-prolyl cis-trans isomerase A (cyclophilin A)
MIAIAAAAALVAGCEDGRGGKTKQQTKKKAPEKKKAPGSGTLFDPSQATEKAPDVFRAKFETSKGDFVVEAHRDWTPNGADRFFNLVKIGFFDDVRFFRVVPGFMVQFGMNGDPKVSAKWAGANIMDDPVRESNTRGFVTFAKSGAPNSRTTQIFINFGDNSRLDRSGFAPFGRVVEGMSVVDAIHAGYGERPDQNRIRGLGNAYLKKEFPKLDFVKKATILE